MPYAVTDSCPYCARPLEGLELIAAYRAVFSEAYATLKTDVAGLRREIDQAFGDRVTGALETLMTQNRSDFEFWQRYCELNAAAVTTPVGLAASIRAVHKAAIALLDLKAQAPLDAVAPDQPFTEASAAYGALGGAVQAHNVAVSGANTTIEATRAATAAADVNAAEAALSRMKAIRKRHEPNSVAACSTYLRLSAEKVKIDLDKEAVRAKLDECSARMVKPYEARINDYLEAFNAGFRIAETKHVYSAGMVSSSTRSSSIRPPSISATVGLPGTARVSRTR